jgi:hypothetical protein
VLRFVRAWGPFASGDELELPAWNGDLQTRGVRLRTAGADVVAVDADGAPALVVARIDAGHAVTCAYPVELVLAGVPDAHGSSDRSWGLYAGLAELAHIASVVDHPDVTAGSLLGPLGGALVVTNHSGEDLDVDVRVPAEDQEDLRAVSLEPFGSSLLQWRSG